MARNSIKKATKQLAQTAERVAANGHDAPKPSANAALTAKPPHKPAVVPVQPPGSPKVEVAFALLDLGATRVSLSGDFNGWSPDAAPMKREDAGHWETTVELAPGRYEYKFVVDGQWIPDPLAHDHVWNHHGTLNSVIEVRA